MVEIVVAEAGGTIPAPRCFDGVGRADIADVSTITKYPTARPHTPHGSGSRTPDKEQQGRDIGLVSVQQNA